MSENELVDVPGFGPLPAGHYAFPGPLRDALVSAILSGAKTSTTSLVEEYARSAEPLPRVGELEAVLDSDGSPVCVTRTTAVLMCRLAEVTDAHARAEGEGYEDVASWRIAHEGFWRSPEFTAEIGQPALVLDDDTQVVCMSFEVVERLASPA